MDIWNMPNESVVDCVCLNINILLQKFNINFSSSISHTEADSHILEHFEFQIALILVVFNLNSHYIFASFFGVKDIDSEWQVFFGLWGVSVPQSINPSLGGESLFAIFSFDRLLLIPSLLVKLWMNLENKPFEIVIPEQDFWRGFLDISQSHVHDTFKFKFLDIAIFCDLTRDSLIDLHLNIFS